MILAHNNIPLNAHAGPKILNPLEAKMAAMSDDQIAVINPCTGLAPLAIAREIESGMVTIATTSPDFRLCLKLSKISLVFTFIIICKKNKRVRKYVFEI